MPPEHNKTRKIICLDKVRHVCYSVEAGAEQCFIRSHDPDELCQEMPADPVVSQVGSQGLQDYQD